MVMALTRETEDFIESWKLLIEQCNDANDFEMMFKKLDAQIKIYNHLHGIVSNEIGKWRRNCDSKGATSHVVEYLTADALVSSIEENQQTKNAEIQLKAFVRDHKYYFVLRGPKHNPCEAEDEKILMRMESPDNRIRMEGLLYLIYQVRCNLTHGHKIRSLVQLPLLQAVVPVYELVISLTEAKLRV
jgi:hypothetical protein